MHTRTCRDICLEGRIDMHADLCWATCVDSEMCVEMRVDMCTDVCMGMRARGRRLIQFMAYVVMAHVLRDAEVVGRYIYGLCSYGLCAEGHLDRRDGKLLNIEARQGHCGFDRMRDTFGYACRHVSRPVCRHLYRHVHRHAIVL